MKILEPPQGQEYKAEKRCGFCKALLEIDGDDVKGTYDSGDGPLCPPHTRFWVLCAACGESIDIPANDLPSLLRRKVERDARAEYSYIYSSGRD